MTERYVIVGGSGFVGQELISLLQKKDIRDIVVLDIIPPKIKTNYFFCDIEKNVNFEFFPEDIVIHLAARQYHHKVPRKGRKDFFENVNSRGTENILRQMKKCNARKMIFFSTDMVYGKPMYLPVLENHICNPFGYYGQSKKKAEDICRYYRKNENFKITIFRPRMIIGAGRLGILSKLFKLIELNLPVPMIGSGNNYYQMISVCDCATAIIKAVEKDIPDSEYNLGSAEPPTVKTLLKHIIRENHSKSILLPTWGKGIKLLLKWLGFCGIELMYKEQYMIADENYIISTEKAEKELDWHPQYNDKDMLMAAFDNYKREKENGKS